MKKTTAIILAFVTVLFAALAIGCKKEVAVDYESAELLEADLNTGADLTGKVVRFVVTDYKPTSALGYNLYAGEHLNFVSPKNPGANVGDTLTVKITDVYSFLGSWIISYEKQ